MKQLNIIFFFVIVSIQLNFGQIGSNFEGISYSGERPPDPVIAVSNNFIVQAVNKKFAFFNKTGVKIYEETFSTFFAEKSPPQTIFDPKVAYDQYSDRFILLAAGRNLDNSNSNYMLAVSQTSDPNGSWYRYKLNAVDAGSLSQYFIDFPGLGYDEEAIYLTSHQINGFNSHYPKITILRKSEVYSGSIEYRKDFIDFSAPDNSYPSKLKPMRKFGSSSGYYLVNTETPGKIRLWLIENPLSSNVSLTVAGTITLGTYSDISDALQKGTTNTIDMGDYSQISTFRTIYQDVSFLPN